MKKLKAMIAFLLTAMLAGCASEEAGDMDDSRLQVVATTTMITDLLNEIGGDKIAVEGLMGPGIDPHGYQASASDVSKLQNADIIASNGLHLEGKMGDIFENLTSQYKIILVMGETIPEASLIQDAEFEQGIDPHIWFSVRNWKLAADYVTEELSEVDPANAEVYQSNNEAYQAELDKLTDYIVSRVEELPEEQRHLVTAHDAFKYFGENFGFNVVGLQGINTQTEAGTGDVSQLAGFIVENKIKAIFVESSVPTRTIESLQEAVQNRGWAVEIGGELFSDALGDESQGAETYLKMYRKNIDTIVDALK